MTCEKVHLLLSSEINIHKHILFRTVFEQFFACKHCLICAYFSPDTDKTTFNWRKLNYRSRTLILARKQSFKIKSTLKETYLPLFTIYITFSYLADAFIQSDLQMRPIEAIKTNIRATICKHYYKCNSTHIKCFFYIKKTSR